MDFDSLLASVTSELKTDLLDYRARAVAIDECRNWLKKDRLVSTTVLPQSKKDGTLTQEINLQILLREIGDELYMLPVSGRLLYEINQDFFDYNYSDYSDRRAIPEVELAKLYLSNWKFYLEKRPIYFNPNRSGSQYLYVYKDEQELNFVNYLVSRGVYKND